VQNDQHVILGLLSSGSSQMLLNKVKIVCHVGQKLGQWPGRTQPSSFHRLWYQG